MSCSSLTVGCVLDKRCNSKEANPLCALIADGSTFYVNDTPRATGNNGDSGSVEDESGNKAHHGSATLPGGCSLGSNHSAGETGAATGAAGGTSGQAGIKFPSEEGSECSSVTSESGPGSRGQAHACGHEGGRPCSLKSIFAELQDHRENIDRFREKLEAFKVGTL